MDVRPIYHQKDENSEAHLFIGIVAYLLAHGIRKELKKKGYATIGGIYAISCRHKRSSLPA
ncbi:MAG: hypothetical protein LBK94_00195 [Prevotellaceae bacterium]|nr:hypothetical protein [Prevotellaceae bacterium]